MHYRLAPGNLGVFGCPVDPLVDFLRGAIAHVCLTEVTGL
jgi:hypothetical protein